LRHLARREHTRAELERKLAAHLPAGDEAQAEQLRRTLDELAAIGLLSDERAAEMLLAVQGRRFGSRRLKQALLAKGLAPELVTATLRQSRTTEHERALEVWRRRFGEAPPAGAAERARQMRFLAGRGFDTDIVRRVVQGDVDD
jgi:regulatory protein